MILRYVAMIAILLMGCQSVLAEDIDVVVGGWSSHLVQGDYNEVHDMFGVQYKGWGAFKFTNSYNDDGFALARTISYTKRGLVTPQLHFMLVHGYNVEILPIVVPSVYIGNDLVGLDINFVGVAVTANFRFKF